MHLVNFIFPLFLIAGILLAIPIIIHLFNFRKFKKVNFPDIRFLKELKEQTNKRSQLKRKLILASRLLAAACLILAFAQPFFSKNKQAQAQHCNAVSIYIDNSFSMGLEEKGIAKLEIAKANAKNIIEHFAETDKFQILTNDFASGENRFFPQKEALQNLSRIQISATKRNNQFILEKQKKILSTQADCRNVICYISDFQKNTFHLNGDKADTTAKYFIEIPSATTENISIDTIRLSPNGIVLNEQNAIWVKLKNHSESEKQTAINLELNGNIKSVLNVKLKAKSEQTDTINFSTSTAGIQKIKIYINDAPLTFDDTFYVSAKVSSNYSVLILNQNNANAFLSSVFKPGKFFKTENNNVNAFNPSLLENYSLVILNSVNNLNETLAKALKNYVENGGSVFVFAPNSNAHGNINSFLQSTAGCSFGSYSNQAISVSSFNRSHALFSGVFAQIPDNLEFPLALNHFKIDGGSLHGGQKLFSFSNGASFLSSYRIQNGKIFVCASSAEKSSSNFSSSYWFLPLMYKMALSDKASSVAGVELNENAQILIDKKTTQSDNVFHLSNGTIDLIPQQKNIGKQCLLFPGKNIQVADFYNAYMPGSKDSSSMGLNYDRDESEMQFWDIKYLQSNAKYKNAHWLNEKESIGEVINQLQKGTPLWKVFIIFALLFLLIEITLIRFLK